MANILIILIRFNSERLIYDKQSTQKNKNYLIPVGLAYISSVLKKEGHIVTILNLNHIGGFIKDIIINQTRADKYDFIFLGGLSIYYPDIKDVVSYIREGDNKIKIIVGGGVISSQPKIMFNLIKPNYIIIGEGEETARELVNCVASSGNLYDVDGIGFLKNNELIITNERKPIMDLDALPFPDYDGMGYEEYLKNSSVAFSFINDFLDTPRSYTIIGSRSCPYSCTFCYHPIGKKYRQRSINSIMDELKFVINKYKINLIIFLDELFSQDDKRVNDFCKQFKEYTNTLSWKVYWTCSLRVDSNLSLIPIMKQSGCSLVALGLESYSPIILKSMCKHITQEQIKNTLLALTQNNVAVTGNFIFGDVAETMDTAKETIDFYKHNQHILRGSISLLFIIPFQGSPIYTHSVATHKIKDELKFIEDRANYGYDLYNPTNLTNMSNSDFEHLQNIVFSTLYITRKFVIPYIGNDKRMQIKCPYCETTFNVSDRKIPIGLDQIEISCRFCHGRFVLVANNLYHFLLWGVKIFGFKQLRGLKNNISQLINGERQ